jgi:COP9 signalosome complex subunit 2
MQDTFEYTDEEEEQDDGQVALENAYYNAKGLRETSSTDAIAAFEDLLSKERDSPTLWSFKALKQLVKLHLRYSKKDLMLRDYQRLLDVVAQGDIPPNAMEKGMHGMLDRLPSEGTVYDATISCFHPTTGASPNDRLWFKTTLKYGQLCMEVNELAKLQAVLKDLSKLGSSGSHQMEIYALEMQLATQQKDLKTVRTVFDKATAVRGGIPHPRTLALIQELGGKMFMASHDYEHASTTFFQAFKSYDEAGDASRLRCLKYLVMASMLHASTINPFDSQEARPCE